MDDEVGHESNYDSSGGREDDEFCLEDCFKLAFAGTVHDGARFRDDSLNGDNEASTTDDDFVAEQ